MDKYASNSKAAFLAEESPVGFVAEGQTARLKAAVLGATGYSGLELARLLTRHARASAPLLMQRAGKSGSQSGEPEGGVRHLPAVGNGHSTIEPFSWSRLEENETELLFLATPHAVSRDLVPEARARGLRVIDLSGAWRLRDENHRAIYGFEDADREVAAALTEQAVYGIPELNADRIRSASLVANPGCYATSVILALAPLFATQMVDRDRGIIADSKSGVSGAGKEPTARTHFVSVADNFSAYSLFAHRHTGEILEQLNLGESEFIFTPHLLPIPRGILSTIYVYLQREMTAEGIETCFRSFYNEKPWVRIYEAGTLPEIQFSAHTNYCDLGFSLAKDGRRLIVVSCLDNLLKGAAGQAVQNMNLMYGWSETEGLQ
jgi:N-acetyl-gamma-glutamyl-phosphate reductase